jgi:hypothetical protein
MKKLTLVSFVIGGVRKSVFIDIEYINVGLEEEENLKPVLEMDVINSLIIQEYGYLPSRGITFTIG